MILKCGNQHQESLGDTILGTWDSTSTSSHVVFVVVVVVVVVHLKNSQNIYCTLKYCI